MGVTIKDVARETNLAISTISKYMNGGKVRKKNEEIIENAIRKLNYSPNSTARGLRTSKTYRVGLMMGTGNSPHTAKILNEIERNLRVQGYSLLFLSHEDNMERIKKYVDYMVDHGVDGIIVTSYGKKSDYLQRAREMKIPVVALEECYTKVDTDCVQVNCAGGAYEMVEYLIAVGHREIAVINGPEDYKLTARERKRGYLRVMEDYEIPVKPEYLIAGDYGYKSGYEGIKSYGS